MRFERKRTHEGFGSESGTGSDEPAEISDPQHRRGRRDLPLRGLVALAIAGPTVHCQFHQSVITELTRASSRVQLGFRIGE